MCLLKEVPEMGGILIYKFMAWSANGVCQFLVICKKEPFPTLQICLLNIDMISKRKQIPSRWYPNRDVYTLPTTNIGLLLGKESSPNHYFFLRGELLVSGSVRFWVSGLCPLDFCCAFPISNEQNRLSGGTWCQETIWTFWMSGADFVGANGEMTEGLLGCPRKLVNG